MIPNISITVYVCINLYMYTIYVYIHSWNME